MFGARVWTDMIECRGSPVAANRATAFFMCATSEVSESFTCIGSSDIKALKHIIIQGAHGSC